MTFELKKYDIDKPFPYVVATATVGTESFYEVIEKSPTIKETAEDAVYWLEKDIEKRIKNPPSLIEFDLCNFIEPTRRTTFDPQYVTMYPEKYSYDPVTGGVYFVK